MILHGIVSGAVVWFFKDLRLKPHRFDDFPATELARPVVDVLCFGVRHEGSTTYDRGRFNEKPLGTGGVTYVPKWLERLAGTPNTIAHTLILLECPPFTPETLELRQIVQTHQATSDPILAHSFQHLYRFFRSGGSARRSGGILDGADLRYRYVRRGDLLLRGPDGTYRSQTLHKDLPEDLGMWVPSPRSVLSYYEYLTGVHDDKGAYRKFTEDIIGKCRGVNAEAKRAIFAQAASHCRPVYAELPIDLKRQIIQYLTDRIFFRNHREPDDFFNGIIHRVEEENKEIDDQIKDTKRRMRTASAQEKRGLEEYLHTLEKPMSITKAVIEYGLAEHLMNLYLLGNILQPDSNFKNVIIVAGLDHIKVIGNFLKNIGPQWLAYKECVEHILPRDQVPKLQGGDRLLLDQKMRQYGTYTELLRPINIV